MIRGENALPFRFAEIAIILDLVGALVDELFAGVVGCTRDGVLALAAGYYAGFKAIKSRTNTLLLMPLRDDKRYVEGAARRLIGRSPMYNCALRPFRIRNEPSPEETHHAGQT
jgi:hypothetical protein